MLRFLKTMAIDTAWQWRPYQHLDTLHKRRNLGTHAAHWARESVAFILNPGLSPLRDLAPNTSLERTRDI